MCLQYSAALRLARAGHSAAALGGGSVIDRMMAARAVCSAAGHTAAVAPGSAIVQAADVGTVCSATDLVIVHTAAAGAVCFGSGRPDSAPRPLYF